jgi:putative zinc finger/helix-turn-helix YgiT family protein
MKTEMIKLDIPIPTSDGKSVAYTISVEVPAQFDEELQDYILDGATMAEIDRVKARHMGLLSPKEIKALRDRLGVTQKEIAELLQIGAKSWSRWENGRERPSRSMNILMRALDDGKMDLNYLRSLRAGTRLNVKVIHFLERRKAMANRPLSVDFSSGKVCENKVA